MAHSDRHRELHEMFNSRDFEAIAARFNADAVYTDNGRQMAVKGGDEFADWLGGWTTAMSDARITEPRYLDAGDASICMFVGRGRNDGPFGPLPASNQELTFAICEILGWDAQGNVTWGELYYDAATILGQMGVLPPMGSE